MNRIVVSLVFVLLALTTVLADSTGTAVKVIDGDTFQLESGMLVRLKGIEGLELSIQWGPREYPWSFARDRLSRMILGKEVILTDVDTVASFLFAYVFLDSTSVNLKMVADGYAMADLRYEHRMQHEFLQAETEARKARSGLWGKQTWYERCFDRPKVDVDTSGWRIYRNKEYGFEIKIPGDAVVAENSHLTVNLLDTSGSLIQPKSLTIAVNPTSTEECYHYYRSPEMSDGKVRETDTVCFGDICFYKQVFLDVATGDNHYTTSYSVMRDNLCYELSYIPHYVNPDPLYPYPPPGLDRERILRILDQLAYMISTFRFLKNDTMPFIEVLSPNGGEMWIEGQTYEITWKSLGVDEVWIGLQMGGKDKGHLGEKRIDAKSGKFTWTIPIGFVTGFGISKSDNMRLHIYDAQHNHIHDASDNNFTIQGR